VKLAAAFLHGRIALMTHLLPSRRQFVASSAAALGLLTLGCTDDLFIKRASDPAGLSPLPLPASSGIEHVIVVMMENRSFDHFLGWLPGADGRQAGLTYVDANGVVHPTFPLAPDFQGCGYRNPDNSYAGGRVEYNDGACDGWLQVNDAFSIGYYRPEDLPFFGPAALDWMTFDRYFSATMSQTGPNRLYQFAAQTDRLSNTGTPITLPTIVDRLTDRGLETLNYYSNVPGLRPWGAKYVALTTPIDAFYADCAAGQLPAVAFVDPPFGGPGRIGQDDHPFADVRTGEAFLNRVYAAVTSGPAWAHTVLIINFDEWGGFFDHVPPPTAPIPDADRAAGNTDGLLGFRTPALLISPFARRGYTSHVVYDHTSVLRLIEWRWDLPPLTVRDATANNLAADLDFEHPTLQAPVYIVPAVADATCPPPLANPRPPREL
jgi:phospholipase C